MKNATPNIDDPYIVEDFDMYRLTKYIQLKLKGLPWREALAEVLA